MNQTAYLIEEDIFAIAAFGCEIFEVSILTYAVLKAKLLPELRAN